MKQIECVHKRKKEWINETIRQIEENYKKNELRKFFSEIKQLKQQNTRLPYMCEGENNTVITQTDQILNRWKDYFSTILNLDTDHSLSNHRLQPTACNNNRQMEKYSQQHAKTTDRWRSTTPSYNEVCSIINKLKSNKAGGTDNIIPELVKQGGRTLKQRIYQLIQGVTGGMCETSGECSLGHTIPI